MTTLANAMTVVEKAARAAGYGVLPRANFSKCRNEFEILRQAIETGHANYDITRDRSTRYEAVVLDPANRAALIEQAGANGATDPEHVVTKLVIQALMNVTGLDFKAARERVLNGQEAEL